MANEKLHAQLEKLIIEAEKDIELRLQDFIWIEAAEVQAFLKSWRDLVAYYAAHTDQVGAEMLRKYIHFMRFFIKMMFDSDEDQEQSTQAEALLTYLEGVVEELIREVEIYHEAASGDL